MFGFCPLASGSKGNSLFIGTKKTRVLVDMGISTVSLIGKLEEIGVEVSSIQAVLITHEHSDHIGGLAPFIERYKIPVLANAGTAKGIYEKTGLRSCFKIFTTGEPFSFGDLEIHPFSVPHDTSDPVAFTVATGNVKLGLCTDLGHVTSLVRKQLEKCDYLCLEANHQPSMVHSSNRPEYLKKRILGKQGHLSNEQCANLLSSLLHPQLKHVHLAHLSAECNTEEVALEVVRVGLAGLGQSIEFSIAHQERISKCILF